MRDDNRAKVRSGLEGARTNLKEFGSNVADALRGVGAEINEAIEEAAEHVARDEHVKRGVAGAKQGIVSVRARIVDAAIGAIGLCGNERVRRDAERLRETHRREHARFELLGKKLALLRSRASSSYTDIEKRKLAEKFGILGEPDWQRRLNSYLSSVTGKRRTQFVTELASYGLEAFDTSFEELATLYSTVERRPFMAEELRAELDFS